MKRESKICVREQLKDSVRIWGSKNGRRVDSLNETSVGNWQLVEGSIFQS